MKVLVQRVLNASLRIDGTLISEIGKGYLLFVGFEEGDELLTMDKMASKIAKSRLFEDENGKTNLSIKDVSGSILSVSQFTLAADLKEGNRPSFQKAMKPEKAKTFYALWNEKLRSFDVPVKEGVFGADMKITLCNDGPFTIIFDSKELFGEKK